MGCGEEEGQQEMRRGPERANGMVMMKILGSLEGKHHWEDYHLYEYMLIKTKHKPDIVGHAYNPSTQELR